MISEKEIRNLFKKRSSYGLDVAVRNLIKELSIYNQHVSGLKVWKKSSRHFKTKRIQIGGGSHYLQGFLNIDISQPADLICDVREGIPLIDQCSDYIFSEHFLEHLDYPRSTKKIINECFRILRSGGDIVIGVPDSNLVLEGYANKDRLLYSKMVKKWYKNRDCLEHFNVYIDLINYHFRDQIDNERYTPHYWAYDFEKLESLLSSVGFINVRRWQFDKKIANPKREWATLYVIAEKP